MKVSIDDIYKAHERIKNIIQHTEMAYSHSASKLLGYDCYFKFENTQRTGSFKIRGAYNKIFTLTDSEKARGVVASSAGNHAQGVALSAKLAGVKSTIVMPVNSSLNKKIATESYGADLILHGDSYDDAFAYAKELEKQKNFVYVHAYEDPAIVAGQGTIGVEMLQAVPDLDTIVVPIGGGGVISGVAIAAKSINPKIRVVGVQSNLVPSMEHLFSNKPLPSYGKRVYTIADGIAVKSPSKVLYENFISKFVDDVVTVTDDEIAEAMVYLLERTKNVTEGSGATGFAAVMKEKTKFGKKVGVLLTGGNIDLNIISQVIQRGQIQRGRIVEISVLADDRPGVLNSLTQIIAEQNANVIEVQHDRVSKNLSLRETKIDFVIETVDQDHVDKLRKTLIENKFRLI